jgi:hypothetical protein
MALQISHRDRTGLVHSAAYARILAVRLLHAESRTDVQVGVYHNKSARDDGFAPVVEQVHSIEGTAWLGKFGDVALANSAATPMKSGYAFLKTLDDYSSSTSV